MLAPSAVVRVKAVDICSCPDDTMSLALIFSYVEFACLSFCVCV